MGYAGAYAWREIGEGLQNIGRRITERRSEKEDEERRRLQENERLEDKEFKDLQWSLEHGGGAGPAPTIEGPGAMAPIAEQDPLQAVSAIEGARMPSTLPPQYEVGSQLDPRYSETPGGNYFKHPAVAEQEERDRREAAVLAERERVAAAAGAERARLTGVYAGLPNVTGPQATALGGGAAAGVVFRKDQPDKTISFKDALDLVKSKYKTFDERGNET